MFANRFGPTPDASRVPAAPATPATPIGTTARSVARALAIAGCVLPGAALAAGWDVDEREDPFAGSLVTAAGTVEEDSGSRLAVECLDADGSHRLRFRVTDPAAVDGAGAQVPAEQVLFKVDDRDVVGFGPSGVIPARDAGGGLLVEFAKDDARPGSLVAALGSGDTAWVKVRTVAREYLYAYDLRGAAKALRAPTRACAPAPSGVSVPTASVPVSTRPASSPSGMPDPAGSSTGSMSPPAAPLASVSPGSVSPRALSAASAALPDGVTMDGLVAHLDTVLVAVTEALERVDDDPGRPGAAVPALRDADEGLANFHALFRRLPDAAKSPLADMAAGPARRIRALSGEALERPASAATLEPVVRPMLETLAAIAD